MARLAAILFGWMAIAAPAHAHGLDAAAAVVGDRIEGGARYLGGPPAARAAVLVEAPPGSVVARLTADDQGRFVAIVIGPVEHRIEIDAGEGHVARIVIPAGDIAAAATANGVGPARASSLAYGEGARFRDVAGGLGYIVGLAGLALWLRDRRRRST